MKKLYVVLLFVTHMVYTANGMDFQAPWFVVDEMAFVNNNGLACLSLQELKSKKAEIQKNCDRYVRFIEATQQEIAFIENADKHADSTLLELHKKVHSEKMQAFKPERTTAQMKLAEYSTLSPTEKSQLINILPSYLSEGQYKISQCLDMSESAAQAGINLLQLDPFQAYWLALDCSSQFVFETDKFQKILAMQYYVAPEKEFWMDKRVEYQAELEYKEKELAAALKIHRLYDEIYLKYSKHSAGTVINSFVNKRIMESKKRAVQQYLQFEKEANDKIIEEQGQRLKAERKARRKKLNQLNKTATSIAQDVCNSALLMFDHIAKKAELKNREANKIAQKEKEKKDRVKPQDIAQLEPVPKNEWHQIKLQNVSYPTCNNSIDVKRQRNRTGTNKQRNEIASNEKETQEADERVFLDAAVARAEAERLLKEKQEADKRIFLDAAVAREKVEKIPVHVAERCEFMKSIVLQSEDNVDNDSIDTIVSYWDKNIGLFQDNLHASQEIICFLESYLNDYATLDLTLYEKLHVVLVRDLHRKIFAAHRDLAKSDLKEEKPQFWRAFVNDPLLHTLLASNIASLQNQYKDYPEFKRIEIIMQIILPAEKAVLEKEGKLLPLSDDYAEKVRIFNEKNAAIVLLYNNLVKLSRLIDIQAIIAPKHDINNLPGFLKQNDWENFSVKLQELLNACSHNDVQKLNFKDITCTMFSSVHKAVKAERGTAWRDSAFDLLCTQVIGYLEDTVCSEGSYLDQAKDQQRVFEHYCNRYGFTKNPDTISALADIAKMHCYVLERVIEYKNKNAACAAQILPEQQVISQEGSNSIKDQLESTISNSTIEPSLMDSISSEVAEITLLLTNLLESSDPVTLGAICRISLRLGNLDRLLGGTQDARSLDAYFKKTLCLKLMFIRRVAEMHLQCKGYETIEEYNKNREQAEKNGAEPQIIEAIEDKIKYLRVFDGLKYLQNLIIGDPQLKSETIGTNSIPNKVAEITLSLVKSSSKCNAS